MFEPENDLERSLVKATADSAHRPQFYRDVLTSTFYILNESGEQLDIRDGMLQKEASVPLPMFEQDGKKYIPVYSSPKRMVQSLQRKAKYLALNAKGFFTAARGVNVLLNPGLEYGKQFTPEEIAALLDDSLFRAFEERIVQQRMEVKIGQPAVYPTKLVGALSRSFALNRNVKAAYLAHVQFPDGNEPPHTLIGIDAEGDWQQIVGDSNIVAAEVIQKGEIVDVTPIKLKEGVNDMSRYMVEQTTPFYERRS